MKRIQALVRPAKLDALRGALENASVRSITITDVRHRGPEKRPVIEHRYDILSGHRETC